MDRAKVTEEGVADTRGPGGEPGLWAETACAEGRCRRAPGLTESRTSHSPHLWVGFIAFTALQWGSHQIIHAWYITTHTGSSRPSKGHHSATQYHCITNTNGHTHAHAAAILTEPRGLEKPQIPKLFPSAGWPVSRGGQGRRLFSQESHSGNQLLS